jgi:hypothetical protein
MSKEAISLSREEIDDEELRDKDDMVSSGNTVVFGVDSIVFWGIGEGEISGEF